MKKSMKLLMSSLVIATASIGGVTTMAAPVKPAVHVTVPAYVNKDGTTNMKLLLKNYASFKAEKEKIDVTEVIKTINEHINDQEVHEYETNIKGLKIGFLGKGGFTFHVTSKEGYLALEKVMDEMFGYSGFVAVRRCVCEKLDATTVYRGAQIQFEGKDPTETAGISILKNNTLLCFGYEPGNRQSEGPQMGTYTAIYKTDESALASAAKSVDGAYAQALKPYL